MKQIITSLQEVTLSRIRNPILGAFIFSWSALNIKGLALFLFNPIPEKIVQIKNWQPNSTDDLLIPLGLSFLYLVLLPLLQIAHQYLEEGFFQPIKYKIKHRSLRNYYKGMREVNESKADADEERIAKLKEANVLNWPDEKKRITAISLKHKEDISKKIREMKEIELKVIPTLERSKTQTEAYKEYTHRLSLITNALGPTKDDETRNDELVKCLGLVLKDLQAINRGKFKEATHLKTHYIFPNSKQDKYIENQSNTNSNNVPSELNELEKPTP